MGNTSKPLNRAVAALNSLLTQASAIDLKEIGVEWPVAGGGIDGHEIDILAHVEVFGHSHTLACRVSSGSEAHRVRTALKQLREQIAFLPGKVTPILILPVLSAETQALCEESNAACLDLHGNGRLAIDEIFVSIRSLPRLALHRPASSGHSASSRRPTNAQAATHATEGIAGESVLRGFGPVGAGLSQSVTASRRQARTR